MSPIEQKLFSAKVNLISLPQAAKLTPYSAEYLSLLARKGKLKSIKISRDWMTTREIIFKYVAKQEARQRKFLKRFEAHNGSSPAKLPELSKNQAPVPQRVTGQAGFVGIKLVLAFALAVFSMSTTATVFGKITGNITQAQVFTTVGESADYIINTKVLYFR